MNISTRHLFLSAGIAFFLAFTFATFAQDTKQPASAEPTAGKPAVNAPADQPAVNAPADQSASSASVAPAPAAASDEQVATPAAAPADAASTAATPAEETATPATTPADGTPGVTPAPESESHEAPKLRRLDTDENPPAPKTHKEIIHERIERAKLRRAERRANAVGRDIVNIFSSSDLPKGEKADSVVSVFGSSTAEGEVMDAVVSVFGNSRADGPVADAVVAVFGDNEVNGPVGNAVVAVLGNNTVNSHVSGDVVAVLGDIKLGPNAVVDGQVVCVGGNVTKDPQAVLRNSIQNVGWGRHMHGMVGLKAWVRECLLYGRPLAFGPNLMWAWWVALAFLAFYVVLALLFGRGINKCVDTLEQRPGYSILTALLTVLLAPIAIIVLAITGIGIAVIPFLAAALFFATLFGKAVMLAWIGRRVGKLLGMDHPALAVLIGGVIVLFLYTVPFVGFILYKLLGWIGIGVVVYTLLGATKRQKPMVSPPAPGLPVVPPMPGATPIDPITGAPLAAGMVAPVVAVPVATVPPVVAIPAVTLPRAGFWIRMAALLLDVIIVAVICSMLSGFLSFGPHLRVKADLLPALAIYGAVMWKLRGSTIGGIVCGLKVVRLDDRPLDWGTAIVRALGCFLSLIVCGLGFIWVAFDSQRQSWHDKIAGTTVVHVPKGVSLV